MAIEYTLYFDADRSALELCQVICNPIIASPAAVPQITHSFAGPGLQGAVLAPDDLTRKFIHEDFSVDARVQENFRLDKFNLEHAQDSLVRCISALTTADAGDMILLFNGELVVLQRKGHDLLLRDDFSVWTPERASLLTPSHRRGPI